MRLGNKRYSTNDFSRFVILDHTPILKKNNEPYLPGEEPKGYRLKIAVANDIESDDSKLEADPNMIAKGTSHINHNGYITYLPYNKSQFDKIMSVANTDGDYPVFDAKILYRKNKDNVQFAYVNTKELRPTNQPFDMNAHKAMTEYAKNIEIENTKELSNNPNLKSLVVADNSTVKSNADLSFESMLENEPRLRVTNKTRNNESLYSTESNQSKKIRSNNRYESKSELANLDSLYSMESNIKSSKNKHKDDGLDF